MDVIYLDNNATTKSYSQVCNAMHTWMTCSVNPSSDHLQAKKAKQLMEQTKSYIARHCGVEYKPPTSDEGFSVILTSGATESNCFILKSTVEAFNLYLRKNNKNNELREMHTKAHVVTSAIEHSSIMNCCKYLSDNDIADISYVKPNMYGVIEPSMVGKEIIPGKTCIISIMHINNEIGSINDIKAIGAIAHKNNIPFHTDAVQSFGKFKLNLLENNIDAISASFHKFHGPMGLGVLLINNSLIRGYNIHGQILGEQQNGLRGGTENMPAIAGGLVALKLTFVNRTSKNNNMFKLKQYLINELIETGVKIGDYSHYYNNDSGLTLPALEHGVELVILGDRASIDKTSPNTILLAIAWADGEFCNVMLKKELERHGIICSIGSACNTHSDKASHVLFAINAPRIIRRSVIRISTSDFTTRDEITYFVQIYIRACAKQIPELRKLPYIQSSKISKPVKPKKSKK